jgi:hypothetical protein
MTAPTPPIVLVTTWLQILRADTDEEARLHSKRMLNRAFGTAELAAEYVEQTKDE